MKNYLAIEVTDKKAICNKISHLEFLLKKYVFKISNRHVSYQRVIKI